MQKEHPNVKLTIKGVERREWRSHLAQQQKVNKSIILIEEFIYLSFSYLKEISFRLHHSFMKVALQNRTNLLVVVQTSPS